MLFFWSDKYTIGVKEIDEQHKEIIELLNHMHEAMNKKDAGQDVVDVVSTLAIYVKLHFQTEESLMAKIGYPHLERQQRAHRDLTHRVQGLLLKMKKGETPSPRSIVALLKSWLIEHIEKEDLKIGTFLRAAARAKKIAQPAS